MIDGEDCDHNGSEMRRPSRQTRLLHNFVNFLPIRRSMISLFRKISYIQKKQKKKREFYEKEVNFELNKIIGSLTRSGCEKI